MRVNHIHDELHKSKFFIDNKTSTIPGPKINDKISKTKMESSI